MRFFVHFEMFHNIHRPEDVQDLRKFAENKFRELKQSGKLTESGIFADARAGFLLLEANTPAELQKLLAPLHDYAKIETHPVVSVEELGNLFKELAGAAAAR